MGDSSNQGFVDNFLRGQRQLATNSKGHFADSSDLEDIDVSPGMVQSEMSAYSGSTPAQQHEKLLFMNGKVHSTAENNLLNSNDYGRTGSNNVGHADSNEIGEPQFLDDIFSSSNLHNEARLNNLEHSNSVSYDANDASALGLSTGLQADFLFNQRDASQQSYFDDFSSSLGSSVNSDVFPSSYSSGLSYQPQTFAPSTSQSNAPNYLNSMRSAGNSLRAGNYLSSSLRQNNSYMSNSINNALTPSSVTSSVSRNTSVSNNNSEGMVLSPGSGPKTLGQLSTDDKLRRKREFHNAVERRRRELIKEKIKELGNLVPPSLLHYDDKGKKIKANKGTILNKTVEYLYYLKDILDAQDRKKQQLQKKIGELENMSTNINYNENQTAIVVKSEKNISPLNDDISQERIIDTRSIPQDVNSSSEQEWNRFQHQLHPDIYEQNAQQKHNNLTSYDNGMMNDDLDQFLSGAVIEAEDNAKLMFNDNGTTPADFLLEFDS